MTRAPPALHCGKQPLQAGLGGKRSGDREGGLCRKNVPVPRRCQLRGERLQAGVGRINRGRAYCGAKHLDRRAQPADRDAHLMHWLGALAATGSGWCEVHDHVAQVTDDMSECLGDRQAGRQIGRALVPRFRRLPRGDRERLGGQAAGRQGEANLARERDRKWLHCRWGALQPDPAKTVLSGDRADCAVQQGHVHRTVFRRKA